MLTGFKRFLLILGLLLVALAVLVFILENRQASHLVFLGWLTPALPVSVLMSLAFIVGAVFSLLLNLWLLGRLHARIARQQRELLSLRKGHEVQSAP
ncbi:lipopolysaccharide assembly protein LapA domain-containing protein [Pseudomonas sp. J452]|uniref:lipopolysaccharide assembly protein LapA domain-containing protein n=1 Tax=Pseudomonas sp. J452 TaxID=2898441 RepID=UPI0021AD9D80|nr:lipopolysaccharide assembly protein LapA domain-containing protein [Pseudomonas sp. J452]UUY08082.1 lipopolysaccharide assembly protein LapA domain-containing protein [Pseudomonas sp. J452]